MLEARPERQFIKSTLALTALLLTLFAYAARSWLLKVRFFDADEFEHLHVAWCISKGMLPYRDFFEHHTPWFHFFLAIFLPFFSVDKNPDSAIAFIFFARGLEMILTGAALALTFLLARLWQGSRVAWVATVLLVATAIFTRKTLEIRPDVLALVLWLGCLLAAVRAVSDEALSSGRRAGLFVLSGALLGGAIMTAQKLLFALPGFTTGMLWYLIAGNRDWRPRLREGLLQFVGFAITVGITLGLFWTRGALTAFVESNLLINLHLKPHVAPYRLSHHILRFNPILTLLGACVLIREALQALKRPRFSAEQLLYLSAITLIAGIFEMGFLQSQYYLLFLPLLAIFAASYLVSTVDVLAGSRWLSQCWARAIFAIVLGAGAYYIVVALYTPHEAPPIVALSIAALLSLAALLVVRSPDGALALILIAFSICSFQETRDELNRWHNNSSQLQEIRFVLQNTTPSDTVMDGRTGFGVFRPHAYFYWFVNRFVLRLLTDDQRRELLIDLQFGRIAPRLIFLDRYLRRLSPDFRAFCRLHYAPVKGERRMWRRVSPPDARLNMNAPGMSRPVKEICHSRTG